ncbi:class I adenylate-forming enzyme family protein [Aureimonas mangrovi]|uniref:class I adenylate-forming enzyme family protein n=1 Tax=Aureimonas mangrovi TaxID=2758041 RepID=UPI00163DDEF2|nr:AMP-binding protein [Aureimonas mangrovi]
MGETRDERGGWPAISLNEAHRRLTAPGSEFGMDEIRIDGRPVRIWKNAPATLRAVFEAGRGFGEKDFIVHEGERVSFEGFARATLHLANAFVDAGTRPGDRIAVAMRNLPEWITSFFAASLAGAIVVPVNAWWSADELAYGLADSGARLLVCDAERLERARAVQDRCPDLARILVCRADEATAASAGATRVEALIGTPDRWADLASVEGPDIDAQDPDAPAALFYTSGTTGRPKGAVNSHRNITSNVMAHGFSQARVFLRRGQAVPVPPPDAPQKVSLLSIPLFHVTGCCATMLSALYRGTRLVLTRRFDAQEALAIIERERVTTIGGVPTVAWRILDHPARGRYDLSSLQVVSYGGAPAAPELVRRLESDLPLGLGAATGWGMTETSATFTHHMAEDYAARPGSCGPALPVCDMRIVGDDGAALPPGSVGELQVRGPMVVSGYWQRPDADAETFVEGWLRTGDLASIDEEGFLTIHDRLKDMIIRGGENIYCVEVEAALYEHPDVTDAAIVPIAHPTLGEEPGAVVSLREGAKTDETQLREFLAGRIAAFKLPVRYVFLDTLGRNAAGKILKRPLRSLF